MKPRLKLLGNGTIELVQPGQHGWGERAAKRFIQRHYGSLQNFAIRFNFPYSAVCNAVKDDRFEKTAGPVAVIRQFLGLKSNPTKASLSLSNAQRGRRAEVYVPPKSKVVVSHAMATDGLVRDTHFPARTA